jgi:hypothetical protein
MIFCADKQIIPAIVTRETLGKLVHFETKNFFVQFSATKQTIRMPESHWLARSNKTSKSGFIYKKIKMLPL